jgi:hypothetical protein
MTSADLFRRLARAEYALASAPLHALDRTAARHLPEDSTLRIIVEAGVDALDSAADRWLGRTQPTESEHPESEHPESEHAESWHPESEHGTRGTSPKDSGPPAPGTDPSERETPNTDVLVAPTGPDPDEVPTPGHVRQEVDRVAEELLEELEEAPLVGELAESPEEEKQRMADLRARHLVEEFEAEQRARHARFQDS